MQANVEHASAPEAQQVVQKEPRYKGPSIYLVSGAILSGKTTTARKLAETIGAVPIDVDQVRNAERPEEAGKRFAQDVEDKRQAQTYAGMLVEVKKLLEDRKSVVISATWSKGLYHSMVRQIANETDVPLVLIHLDVQKVPESERPKFFEGRMNSREEKKDSASNRVGAEALEIAKKGSLPVKLMPFNYYDMLIVLDPRNSTDGLVAQVVERLQTDLVTTQGVPMLRDIPVGRADGLPIQSHIRLSLTTISDRFRGPRLTYSTLPSDIVLGTTPKVLAPPTPQSDFMLSEIDRNIQIELPPGFKRPDVLPVGVEPGRDGNHVVKRDRWHSITMPSRASVVLVNPDDGTIVLVNRLIPAAHGPVVMFPSIEVPNNAGYVQLSSAASAVLTSIGADPSKARMTEDQLRIHFSPAKSPTAHNILFVETSERLADKGWMRPVPIDRAVNAVFSGGITSAYTQIGSLLAGITYVSEPKKFRPMTDAPGQSSIFAPNEPYVYGRNFGLYAVLSGKLNVTQSTQIASSFGVRVISEEMQHISSGLRFSINTLKRNDSASLTAVNIIDGVPLALTRDEYRPGAIPDELLVPVAEQYRPGAGGRFTENLSGALNKKADGRLETPIEAVVREAFEEINKARADDTEFDIVNHVVPVLNQLDRIRAGLQTDEHTIVGELGLIVDLLRTGKLSHEAAQQPQNQLIRYGEGTREYEGTMSLLRGMTQEELTRLVYGGWASKAFLNESGVSTYNEWQFFAQF